MFNYTATEFHKPGQLAEDVSAFNVRLDFLYNFMPCGMVDPYLAAGPGATRIYSIYPGTVDPGTPGQSTNNDFTANVGGGLKWFLSESFDIRADVRHLWLFNNVKVTDNQS